MSLLPTPSLLIAAIVGALVFIWVCGSGARRRLAKFAVTEPKDRAELEDEFRKTNAQILGTAAVVVVFAYTLTKDNVTVEQVRTQSAASTYSEGIKLLKEEDSTVRAAGIYLVEKVGASETQYKDPITRTLVSFIKQKASPPWPYKPKFVGPDVKAAIHVLGRTAPISDQDKYTLTLDKTNLAGADFGWLPGFKDRRLQQADLRVANFRYADLRGANLSGSEMSDSAAYGPDFSEDIPRRQSWDVWEKYEYAVQFDCADLSDARLDNTGLVGALFGRANMESTNLDWANISRADFREVRNLQKVKFDNACADESPKFPAGFICKLRRCYPSDDTPNSCGFEKPQDSGRDEGLANACRTPNPAP